METIIASYCKIDPGSVWVNGELFIDNTDKQDLSTFLSSLYKQLSLNYPKFFKMDKLCKLGTLAAEILIRNTPEFDSLPKEKIALVFSNNSSSIESDRNHAATIADKNNYFPSPSVFVYTLANIVIGEIAIKHKITGENTFFISEKFDEKLLNNYCSVLLEKEAVSAVLCGWVNLDGNNAEAFVYCVKKGNFKHENKGLERPHTPENIQHLYRS